MNFQPPPNLEEKLRQIFSHGLSDGLGERGKQVCIEAAICEALGELHGDEPSCVHEIDRTLIIGLNDGPWSSPEARAEGMWPLALPQLGTTGRDRTAFLDKVIEGTIRRIVPMALRAAAKTHPNATHREALENAAVRCEKEGSQEAAANADNAAHAARAAATAATDARAAYNARAAATSAYNARAAATATAATAATADAAANAAYAYAYAYAAADAAANSAARAADYAARAAADEVLREMVSVIVAAYAATETTPTGGA